MSKPVVGVIGSALRVEDRFTVQMAGERNFSALAEVAGALPLLFAGTPGVTDIPTLLEAVDGVLLTGGRANVHPQYFGVDPCPRYEPFDPDRDAVALEVTRACVAEGVPILGLCRGIQEMNVAFGGTLHPEIRELPGRMNHRAPRLENGEFHPDPEVVFADRHDVDLVAGGTLARLYGRSRIRVNSLHGQGIEELGDRIVVEGVAEDGTIEAVCIAEAQTFALGIQWHAEYNPTENPVNRTIFEAFGTALRTSPAA